MAHLPTDSISEGSSVARRRTESGLAIYHCFPLAAKRNNGSSPHGHGLEQADGGRSEWNGEDKRIHEAQIWARIGLEAGEDHRLAHTKVVRLLPQLTPPRAGAHET